MDKSIQDRIIDEFLDKIISEKILSEEGQIALKDALKDSTIHKDKVEQSIKLGIKNENP